MNLKKDTLVPPPIHHPVFSIRAEDMAQLSDSTLVIGTKGAGILLWKDDHFLEVTTSDGLSSNMIENVYADDRDNIWVGTLEGLNKVQRINEDSVFVKQFTVHHGMPSNEINRVKTWGEHVWVATTKGLVHFKDHTTLNEQTTPPIFENILVNNEALDSSHTLQFSHRENNFIFNYLTIDYHQNGKVPYRYRLLPAQADWTFTEFRSINFSALQSGDYTFEVQSQNEDGFWSTSTSFDFEIHPPFWQTWWFLTIVASILGFIAFRLYKYRTNQIRHEAAMDKQITELERSALRAQMNPHFIFNCLNSISSFINKGDKVSANSYLATFAKLIRAALNHSMSNKVSLEDELQLLENYIKMEQLRFDHRFDYNIQMDEDLDPFGIEIPPMMVQPFIENAIIHGLAKKEGKGKIDLHCNLQNGELNITITDNGVGIEQSKTQKAASAPERKSVGMTITQKRLELINANNEITVKELKGENGEISGTQVILKIKLE